MAPDLTRGAGADAAIITTGSATAESTSEAFDAVGKAGTIRGLVVHDH